MSSLIIGTAGHIDHGKTTLVKALTGVDTDRLEEEKRRGISIDLGFAHLDLPGGMRAGVVDVPGHERFIRNMLAGAHALDLVLFVVAADDGVMPQTEEHLDILDVLGIKRAVFVITKADLVDDARRREVAAEIQILADGTTLENSPIVPFSSVTGEGLDDLRSAIADIVSRSESRAADGYFRMPVDRAFALQGYGLVVTGTAVSGRVRPGDKLESSPGSVAFRVRTVQVHGEQASIATAGQRVALNLSSTEKSSVERGDVICHERLMRATEMLDGHLRVLPSASSGIKSHQRVRVHVGTAERIGKVVLLGTGQALRPKESGYCQITLDKPVNVLRGDRFVIRDETALRTLGGGVVIHPWPRKHRHVTSVLPPELPVLRSGDLNEAAKAFVAESSEFAVPLDHLVQFFNMPEDALKARLADGDAVKMLVLDEMTYCTTHERLREVQGTVLAELERHHQRHPMEPGMDSEELRLSVDRRIPVKLFRRVLADLEESHGVARDDHYLRLRGHQVRLDEADSTLASRVIDALSGGESGMADLKQIQVHTGSDRAHLLGVLTHLERTNAVVRLPHEMFVLRASLDVMKRRVREFLQSHGGMSPADCRDLFGTSRKYTIPLLEYFDRDGLTIRVGEKRTLRTGQGS